MHGLGLRRQRPRASEGVVTKKSAARLERGKGATLLDVGTPASAPICGARSWLFTDLRCELPPGHEGRHSVPRLDWKPEWSNGREP